MWSRLTSSLGERFSLAQTVGVVLGCGALVACSSGDSTPPPSGGDSVAASATISVGRTDLAAATSLRASLNREAISAAYKKLASPTVRAAFERAAGDASTTPFEQELIRLHSTVTRISDILRRDQSTGGEEVELDVLVNQLRNSPAALRVAELTRSSPMTCNVFETAVSGAWAKSIQQLPEFAQIVGTLRKQCESSPTKVIDGLWSGFANPDWHARVILGDEELPRSDTEDVLIGIGGGALIVIGVIVAATVPGAGPFIGGLLVATGAGLVSYAATGEGYVGLQCTQNADLGVEQCMATTSSALVLGSNGCLASVASCTASSECGNSFTFCTYGCCEAFSSGLAKQESGLSSYAIFMELPAGVLPNEVGIWGSRSVKINDRAQVMRADGSGAPVITTTQGSQLQLGTDTLVGDTVAAGGAFLRDRAVVNGFLSVAGSVSAGNFSTVTVNGTQTVGSAAVTMQQPPTRLFWLTTFRDTGLSNVALEPDQTSVLPPGDYANVSVKPRARLVLQAGQYHFNSLAMDATSILDVPGGLLTKVDVRNSLTMQGTVVQQGPAQTLMLTYVGPYAFVTQAFAGSLVAPYATVNLHVEHADMRASVWGLNVELFEGGRVRLATTSVWDLVSGALGG
jgi:hypothetical protein